MRSLIVKIYVDYFMPAGMTGINRRTKKQRKINMVHGIKELLDALDCPGGHITICVLLAGIGAGLSIKGHPEVGKEFLAFLPIAAYAMRGREKANGVVITSESKTTTSTESKVPDAK